MNSVMKKYVPMILVFGLPILAVAADEKEQPATHKCNCMEHHKMNGMHHDCDCDMDMDKMDPKMMAKHCEMMKDMQGKMDSKEMEKMHHDCGCDMDMDKMDPKMMEKMHQNCDMTKEHRDGVMKDMPMDMSIHHAEQPTVEAGSSTQAK